VLSLSLGDSVITAFDEEWRVLRWDLLLHSMQDSLGISKVIIVARRRPSLVGTHTMTGKTR